MSGLRVEPEIVEAIETMYAAKPTVLVAIDGGGGAGKTTFSNLLVAALRGPARIVRVDDYYIKGHDWEPLRHDDPVYHYFDFERLKEEVLVPLTSQQVQKKEIVIVEGVGTLGEILRDYFDYKIWLEVPVETRRVRGLQRDGHALASVWDNRYIVEDEKYQREQRPQDVADFIVEFGG